MFCTNIRRHDRKQIEIVREQAVRNVRASQMQAREHVALRSKGRRRKGRSMK